MNISPVNFCGVKSVKNQKINPQKQVKQDQPKHHFNIKPFIAGGAAALLLTGTVSTLPQRSKYITIPFNAKDMSITEIAQTYNINEKAIIEFNNISEKNPPENLIELKMPENYDYIQQKIEILQKKLYSYVLSHKERLETETTIIALKQKQQEQKYVSTAYSDGENIYIYVDIDKNAPEYIKEKYEFGINIETLKKLYDIKDGAIEENNQTEAIWIDNDDTGKTGYFDYTRNWFHNGETVKVPISSIKTDKINLSGYMK